MLLYAIWSKAESIPRILDWISESDIVRNISFINKGGGRKVRGLVPPSPTESNYDPSYNLDL